MTFTALPASAPTDACDPLLGYAVYARPMAALVQEVLARVAERDAPPAWLACLNPHSYAVACDEPAFARALRSATWLVPDGAGIVVASRWLRGRIDARLSGPDAFLAISAAMDARGPFRVMFLGSTEDTLAKVATRYRAEFPRAVHVATLSPPFRARFGDDDLHAMRQAIRDAAPDLLWIGMGAPKQELLVQQLGPDAGYRFAGAVGAAFDFYAGNVKRSPAVFRRLGLEWLPRLLQEPRRLWRRTFVSAPRFLGHVAREALAARRGRR